MCGIPAVRGAANIIHRINEATKFDGITVMPTSSPRRYVGLLQQSPFLATASPVGECLVEQGNELVICVMPAFCGHFADYDLLQSKGFIRAPIEPVNVVVMVNVPAITSSITKSLRSSARHQSRR